MTHPEETSFGPAAAPEFTVERCRSGLAASQALLVGAPPGERRRWTEAERFWALELAKAEAAQAKK